MESVSLFFPGEPKAIQSVRFANVGGFARKYQPKANTDWKGYLKLQTASQLPDEWKLLEGPLLLSAEFSYAPLRSMPKRLLRRIEDGDVVYKPTRPDLCDNLMKGLCDALTGVVWRDDAQICRVSSVKRFAMKPGIGLTVRQLEAIENDVF